MPQAQVLHNHPIPQVMMHTATAACISHDITLSYIKIYATIVIGNVYRLNYYHYTGSVPFIVLRNW